MACLVDLNVGLMVLALRANAGLAPGRGWLRSEARLHDAKATTAHAVGKACTAHRDVKVICGFGVQRAVLTLQQHLVQTCSQGSHLSKRPVCPSRGASVAQMPKLLQCAGRQQCPGTQRS